jgi:hypothetical protein
MSDADGGFIGADLLELMTVIDQKALSLEKRLRESERMYRETALFDASNPYLCDYLREYETISASVLRFTTCTHASYARLRPLLVKDGESCAVLDTRSVGFGKAVDVTVSSYQAAVRPPSPTASNFRLLSPFRQWLDGVLMDDGDFSQESLELTYTRTVRTGLRRQWGFTLDKSALKAFVETLLVAPRFFLMTRPLCECLALARVRHRYSRFLNGTPSSLEEQTFGSVEQLLRLFLPDGCEEDYSLASFPSSHALCDRVSLLDADADADVDRDFRRKSKSARLGQHSSRLGHRPVTPPAPESEEADDSEADDSEVEEVEDPEAEVEEIEDPEAEVEEIEDPEAEVEEIEDPEAEVEEAGPTPADVSLACDAVKADISALIDAWTGLRGIKMAPLKYMQKNDLKDLDRSGSNEQILQRLEGLEPTIIFLDLTHVSRYFGPLFVSDINSLCVSLDHAPCCTLVDMKPGRGRPISGEGRRIDKRSFQGLIIGKIVSLANTSGNPRGPSRIRSAELDWTSEHLSVLKRHIEYGFREWSSSVSLRPLDFFRVKVAFSAESPVLPLLSITTLKFERAFARVSSEYFPGGVGKMDHLTQCAAHAFFNTPALQSLFDNPEVVRAATALVPDFLHSRMERDPDDEEEDEEEY